MIMVGPGAGPGLRGPLGKLIDTVSSCTSEASCDVSALLDEDFAAEEARIAEQSARLKDLKTKVKACAADASCDLLALLKTEVALPPPGLAQDAIADASADLLPPPCAAFGEAEQGGMLSIGAMMGKGGHGRGPRHHGGQEER